MWLYPICIQYTPNFTMLVNAMWEMYVHVVDIVPISQKRPAKRPGSQPHTKSVKLRTRPRKSRGKSQSMSFWHGLGWQGSEREKHRQLHIIVCVFFYIRHVRTLFKHRMCAWYKMKDKTHSVFRPNDIFFNSCLRNRKMSHTWQAVGSYKMLEYAHTSSLGKGTSWRTLDCNQILIHATKK